MAPRWRQAGKSDPDDKAEETVVVLTSSDDEEANEDLSLAVVEKAKRSKAKRKGVEVATALVNISSDEAEAGKKEGDGEGREGSRRKKRVKKKKKERVVAAETETPQADISEAEIITAATEVHNSSVGLTDAEMPATKTPEINEAPDNKVLRRLLRGARYFDPGETRLEMCFNCGEEGHMAANCTAERKKRPCFRCGQFGHLGKDCTQGQYCYACKKNGHKAKNCPEKNKNASQDSRVCLKCCGVGHDMFSCTNNYPADDMKEIQCYICNKEGHLCCAIVSDSSSPKVVSCYNCAELGHTGAGCAKPKREAGTVVPSVLCYKCGGEGHFARGCSITDNSVRSVLGVTPKSKKTKMREKEKKFGFRSAPEGKSMKRKGMMHHDKKGSGSSRSPKSRTKDIRSSAPSSSSPKKFKPKIWGQNGKRYENSGYGWDYSTPPRSSEHKRWKGHESSPNHWSQHNNPRYSESRILNSHSRFAQS